MVAARAPDIRTPIGYVTLGLLMTYWFLVDGGYGTGALVSNLVCGTGSVNSDVCEICTSGVEQKLEFIFQIMTISNMKFDDKIFKLTIDLHCCRYRARSSWISSRETLISCIDTGCVTREVYLLTNSGVATLVPDYNSYTTTWKQAGYVNPFEFKWMDYDWNKAVDDALMMQYMELVLATLDEQAVLWYGKENSDCPVYDAFIAFSDSLRRLYSYVYGDAEVLDVVVDTTGSVSDVSMGSHIEY